MNSESNKIPEGAEVIINHNWVKRSSDDMTQYALYWHSKKETWCCSAKITNSDVLAELQCLDLASIGLASGKITGGGMKFDSEKPRYDLLPPVAIDEMAKVMTFGAKKYAPNGWQTVPDGKNRYLAAALRHAFAISRGEVMDSETGLPHAAHLMCCAAFLTELQHGQ